jgi:tRNA-modifying protein YgfZ
MANATAMTQIPFSPQICKDRAVIAVSGVTATDFLQNLLTVDVLAIGKGAAGYGALLSPQGKILHDMFAVLDGETVLLDCDREQAPELLQKLTFYRLRAKLVLKIREDLEIGVMPSAHNNPSPLAGRVRAVARGWGPASKVTSHRDPTRHFVPPSPKGEGLMDFVFADPRLPSLGWRAIAPLGTFEHGSGYAEYCGELGIPTANAIVGQFAHEANLDQLNGLAFAKGCYVGQEIVSRMEHRGTARSRILPFQGNAVSSAEIRSGDVLIGQVLEVGIGLFRIDRLAEVSLPLFADGVAIHVQKPEWLKIEFTVPEIAR